MKKKLLSFSLALMMVLSVICLPIQAFAREGGSYTTHAPNESYIRVIDGPVEKPLTDPIYTTITTFGGTNGKTGKTYKGVVRGNIYLEVKDSSQLTNAKVTLKGQRGCGFTLNGTPVPAGKKHTFNLDLTKSNIIKVNFSEEEKNIEEGTYVISGGVKGENVTIHVGVNVDNPKAWLDGTYVPKMGTIKPAKEHPDEAKVRNAVEGFSKVGETPITVPKGTAATEVFRKFGEINHVTMEGLDQGYIRRINKEGFQAIGEFDINHYSGWMYTVNYSPRDPQGNVNESQWFFPNVGVAGFTFNQDATMRWNFTMAYGKDINAGWGAPNGGDMPTSLRAYRVTPSIADLVPQWANSGRSLDLVK